MDALAKVEREMQVELEKQSFIVLGSAAIVLKNQYAMEKKQILKVFRKLFEAWGECAKTNELSMMQICENETGVEIQPEPGRSWHDIPWLNTSIWDGKMPNRMQMMYIRQQQKKWIPANLMALVCTGIYRAYNWDFEKLVEMITAVDAERSRHTVKTARAKMKEITGVDSDILKGTEAWGDE